VPSPEAQVRTTTAIDRHSRTVRRENLFSTETIARFVRFKGTIRGELEEEDVTLLRQCSRVLTHFGSDSSRGLGFCRFEVSEVQE